VRIAALVLLAALYGCATEPALRAVATLPADARADPRHFLVVTVHNPVVAPARAASTARGYDFIGPYVAGGAACRDSRALASDYGLEQVAAGPFQQVRKLPQAHWIGLAMPRWLLRLPYGKDTAPIERFAFEEMPEHRHEEYLWGNAAFACLCLLAEAFGEAGWEMRPGSVRDLEGLPLHVYKEDGETKVQPCAEVLMTEQTAEALLDNGIMPLVSFKDRDCVRLLRFQSIADPPAGLSGRWM